MKARLKCRICGHVFVPKYTEKKLRGLRDGRAVELACPGCKESSPHHSREDLAKAGRQG